jgi:hypothetical protein
MLSNIRRASEVGLPIERVYESDLGRFQASSRANAAADPKAPEVGHKKGIFGVEKQKAGVLSERGWLPSPINATLSHATTVSNLGPAKAENSFH